MIPHAIRPPCASCPRAAQGLSLPCCGQVQLYTGHCRGCARGDAIVIRRMEECTPEILASTLPDPPSGEDRAAAAVLPVKETLSLVSRMKKCPSWQATSDCGCAGAAKCLLGKGRGGVVNYQECFACLREQDALTEAHRPSTGDSGS